MHKHIACITAAWLALVAGVPASAQSNTLFGGGALDRPPAPQGDAGPGSAQGAFGEETGRRPVPQKSEEPGRRPVPQKSEEPGRSVLAGDPRAPRNPVLLAVSPIAVAPPPIRKIAVHDLITIIIREDKRATHDARLKQQKKWDLKSDFLRWFRLDLHDRLVGQDFEPPTPGIDFAWDNKYDGTGKVDRNDTFITRITAEVIDVKPNGNLVLQARKTIAMDEESQVITLTGTCRSLDVTAQNTVLSTQISDLHIDAQHSGAARDGGKRGWLPKLVDWLGPM